MSNSAFSQSTISVPVTVANGGTGDTSLTEYAPLFGGTTSTGNVQSGSVGTSGQILTSNGAGALPTFQTLPSGVQSMFGMVTSTTLTNTSTETSIISTTNAAGSRTIGANTASLGRAYRLRAGGTIAWTSNPNLQINVYLGGTQSLVVEPNGGPSGVPMPSFVLAVPWMLDIEIICTATGGSGTIAGSGRFGFTSDVVGATSRFGHLGVINSGWDTTSSTNIDVKAKWSSTSTSNIFTCTYCTIDVIN